MTKRKSPTSKRSTFKDLPHQLQIAFLIWLIPVSAAFLTPSSHHSTTKSTVLSSTSLPQNLPPIPIQIKPANLSLTATSYTSLDLDSGKFLLQQNSDSLHAPASTTKLVLSWATLRKCSPDQVVTVAETFKEGTVLGLNQGERITIHNLLYAALLPSDNDAAVALADGCFGSQAAAVQAMNDQVRRWKLTSTRFVNTNGLDDAGNYSTARDLALIGKLTMTDPMLSEIVSTKSFEFSTIDGKNYQVRSTNQLLGSLGVTGVKTGSTDFAGENFIGRAKVSGHPVLTVVLGATDRFADTKKILLEIKRVYQWDSSSLSFPDSKLEN